MFPSSIEVGYGGAYLRPPRPAAKISRLRFKSKEDAGWWAQAKMDGTNSVIFVPPNRMPYAFNRHGEIHKTWEFSAESAKPFASIPGNDWWVFNAELLNKKPAPVTDTNYVHDCLVAAGRVLIDTSYAHRFGIVEDLFRKYMHGIGPGYMVGPNIWLPANIRSGFESALDRILSPVVEGFVFKNPQARLAIRDLIPGDHGCDWLAKHRRESKRVSHF